MTDDEQALIDLMSDISEDHYCAGWMMGLEFALWRMVQGGERRYGFGEVSEAEVARLGELSERTGGWVVWRDETWETPVPMAEWLELYEAGESE